MDLVFGAPFWGAYVPGHVCPKDAELPMGVHHVDLLSGYHRDVVLPSLAQWAAYGYVPNPLLDIAIRVEWKEFKAPELSDDDRAKFLELQVWVVSEITRPKLPIEFVRGYSAPGPGASVVEPSLPKEDLPTLWAVATGAILVGPAREVRVGMIEAMRNFRDLAERIELPADGDEATNGSGPATRDRVG